MVPALVIKKKKKNWKKMEARGMGPPFHFPLLLFTSYVKALDYCLFKWRFTIHQKALICIKIIKPQDFNV